MCQEDTQIEFDFGSGRIISAELCPLDLKKIPIMCHKNTHVKFRCGSI